MKKKCKVCGAEFTPRSKIQVCCCQACTRENKRRTSAEWNRIRRQNGRQKEYMKKYNQETRPLTTKLIQPQRYNRPYERRIDENLKRYKAIGFGNNYGYGKCYDHPEWARVEV